jgi:hypothetical protein
MSGKINQVAGGAFEATGVSLMDRIQGNGGTNITQASITSIAYTVHRYPSQEDAEKATNGTEVIAATALAKTSVVFDSLQTAAPWDSDADATGYNFRYDSVAADRPAVSGGNSYWHRYDVVFTPASGAVFVVSWIVESLPRI